MDAEDSWSYVESSASNAAPAKKSAQIISQRIAPGFVASEHAIAAKASPLAKANNPTKLHL